MIDFLHKADDLVWIVGGFATLVLVLFVPVAKRLAKRTKTPIDDDIVEGIEESAKGLQGLRGIVGGLFKGRRK